MVYVLARQIRDVHERVVERGVDVDNAKDLLALADLARPGHNQGRQTLLCALHENPRYKHNKQHTVGPRRTGSSFFSALTFGGIWGRSAAQAEKERGRARE